MLESAVGVHAWPEDRLTNIPRLQKQEGLWMCADNGVGIPNLKRRLMFGGMMSGGREGRSRVSAQPAGVSPNRGLGSIARSKTGEAGEEMGGLDEHRLGVEASPGVHPTAKSAEPRKPSEAEAQQHEIPHMGYWIWWWACAQGRGANRPHRERNEKGICIRSALTSQLLVVAWPAVAKHGAAVRSCSGIGSCKACLALLCRLARSRSAGQQGGAASKRATALGDRGVRTCRKALPTALARAGDGPDHAAGAIVNFHLYLRAFHGLVLARGVSALVRPDDVLTLLRASAGRIRFDAVGWWIRSRHPTATWQAAACRGGRG